MTLSSHIANTGPIFRIYKTFEDSVNNTILEMSTRCEHFTKEEIKKANKHMKICEASLLTGEMKVKSQWETTMYLFLSSSK